MFTPGSILRATITRQVLVAALFTTGMVCSVSGAEGQTEPTQKLIAVLRSDAGLFEKARACQQLGEFGSKAAVPALAALLSDEHLNAYARSGLEGIPDPSAAAALRGALGTLTGKQLAGVVNSLGVLRDTRSVKRLQPLAANPESGVAHEALLALGRIGNDAAIRILRETLARGMETLRPGAASACLLAAERQLADGHARTARRLYDAVCQAQVSPACRAAATRGAILARKSDGPAFLVQQLESPDRVIRNAALMTSHEMPSRSMADALIAKLEKASPELQVQLLAALADWRNPQTIRAVEARIQSDDPEVRKTALVVLGQIGGPAETGVFLTALRQPHSAEETAITLRNLESLEGPEVDAQVLQALSAENETANRIRLIRLVGARGMGSATAELLRQARAQDEKVSIAALGALGTVAGLPDLPALIAFTRSCSDAAVRSSAAGAMIRLCQKTGNLEAEEALLTPEVEQAPDPGQRTTWLGILVKIGSTKALPLLKMDLQSANDLTVHQAIGLLASSSDPAPVEDLLAVAQSHPNSTTRSDALQAAVQLATTAAEEKQRPDIVILEWMRRADQLAQSAQERSTVLDGLGRWKNIDSFRLLARHLPEPEAEREAGVPLLAMAADLAKQGNATEIKQVLETMAATVKDHDLRQRASAAAAAIK